MQAIVDRLRGKALESRVLAGKDRRPDVEEGVAGRLLERRSGEVRSIRALVGGLQRGLGVELRQAGRLAPKLEHGLVVRVVLEQAQGDQRREDARQRDPEQEEGRQPEAERPEHGLVRVGG